MATITDVCYLTQTPRYGYVTIDDIEWIEDEADKEMLVEHVLKPAAKFFCADNDDMDNEIINEELAKWN